MFDFDPKTPMELWKLTVIPYDNSVLVKHNRADLSSFCSVNNVRAYIGSLGDWNDLHTLSSCTTDRVIIICAVDANGSDYFIIERIQ